MLLSAVSVLVVAQSSSEIPEGLMTNPAYYFIVTYTTGVPKLKSKVVSFIRNECFQTKRIYRNWKVSLINIPIAKLVHDACMACDNFLQEGS